MITPSSPTHQCHSLHVKLEQANRQLLQSEKLAAIGQLAAGVAHEINNPVGYVYSNLQSLEGYLKDLFRLADAIGGGHTIDDLRGLKKAVDYDFLRDDLNSLLAESREGIERVRTIISAMRDFSYIEDDEFKPADIHRAIETTLNLVHNELRYKAKIIREYTELPEVECIISQINQVVMNLLVNASQAIEEFGTIKIRTYRDNDIAVIEIEDSGKGIAPEHLNRVFEPFFTTKPIGKGTGLGLSLSFNIMEKHKGELSVESTLGKGTCFSIKLPITQASTSDEMVNR